MSEEFKGTRMGQILMQEMNDALLFSKTQLIDRVERSKLPEPLFRQNFLNFFIGKENPGPESEVVSAWISIAGSPTAEVDIVDAAGQTLFTAPALFSTNTLNTDRKTHRSLDIRDLYLEVAREEVGLAPVAANLLYQGLTAKSADIVAPPTTGDEEYQKWAKLYDFYKISRTQADQQVTSAAQAAEDDDIVGYD